MGFKDLLDKAKAAQTKARKAAGDAKTKFDERQARVKAQHLASEAAEVKRMDEQMASLKRQEKQLRSQDAINRKKAKIKALEAKVTTKGKVISQISKEVTKLVKKQKKKAKKK
jgi:hypothetical protein